MAATTATTSSRAPSARAAIARQRQRCHDQNSLRAARHFVDEDGCTDDLQPTAKCGQPADRPDAAEIRIGKNASGIGVNWRNGADYYITSDGSLLVKGNAHRGQDGDGRLLPTAEFVTAAAEAVTVKAHTGHAIYLARNGDVLGTGGNVYGPLKMGQDLRWR